MSISAKDLRERFEGLYDGKVVSQSSLDAQVVGLRGLVGDIMIWIEEFEAGINKYDKSKEKKK